MSKSLFHPKFFFLTERKVNRSDLHKLRETSRKTMPRREKRRGVRMGSKPGSLGSHWNQDLFYWSMPCTLGCIIELRGLTVVCKRSSGESSIYPTLENLNGPCFSRFFRWLFIVLAFFSEIFLQRNKKSPFEGMLGRKKNFQWCCE